MEKEIAQFEVYPKYRLHVMATQYWVNTGDEQRRDEQPVFNDEGIPGGKRQKDGPPRITLTLFNDYDERHDPNGNIKGLLRSLKTKHNVQLDLRETTVLRSNTDGIDVDYGALEQRKFLGVPMPIRHKHPSALELQLPQYPTKEEAVAGVRRLLENIKEIGLEQQQDTPPSRDPQNMLPLLCRMGDNASIAEITRAVEKIYDEHEKAPKPGAIDPDKFKNKGGKSGDPITRRTNS